MQLHAGTAASAGRAPSAGAPWPAPGEARERWAQDALLQLALVFGRVPEEPSDAFYQARHARAAADLLEFMARWARASAGFESGSSGFDFEQARRGAAAQLEALRRNSLAAALLHVADATGAVPADRLQMLLAQRGNPELAQRVSDALLPNREAQGDIEDHFDDARAIALARFERRELGEALGLAPVLATAEAAPAAPPAETDGERPPSRARRL